MTLDTREDTAVDVLATMLLLRHGDEYAAALLADLAEQGWHLVHLPTVEQAADAIAHRQWVPEQRHREDDDAAAVLNLIKGR